MKRVGMVVGIVLLAVAVGFVGTAAASDAPDPSEYDTILDGMEGNGTEESPYNVTTITELQAVQGDLSGNYTLGKDVDASETDQWNAGDGFDPIGDSGTKFTGTFDGANNTITELVIDRPNEDRVGLFASTDTDAEIHDIHLEDATVTGNGGPGSGVGSLVGDNDGEINNASASGTVTGKDDRVGGLVGINRADVLNSYATSTVTGDANIVGGLVGHNNVGTISNSYATGDVTGDSKVGGLVGDNGFSTISNSYAVGSVKGDNEVGGLVGVNNPGTISNSYAVGSVEGDDEVGGLVGGVSGTVEQSYWDTDTSGQSTSSGDAIGRTTAEMTGDRAETNMGDFDFEETWETTLDSTEDGYKLFYPILQNNSQHPAPSSTLFADGNGTEAHPFEIVEWNHLDNVRENLGGNFTLVNDLNKSTDGYDSVVDTPTEGFDPIGDSTNSFTGTFDGNENTVTGLTINRSGQSHVGLFGEINGEAVIENLKLASVDITGDSRVGGLVGYSGNDPNVIRNITASGSVIADGDAGGLIGTNHQEATIANVSANVTVTSTSGSVGGLVGWGQFATLSAVHAVGDVSGGDRTGGLVGDHDGTITQSYATGAVSDGDTQGGLVARLQSDGQINESYATGSVGTSGNVGGLVGTNDGAVDDSYWDKGTTGQEDPIGDGSGTLSNLVGFGDTNVDEPAAEMQGINATVEMPALDFSDAWRPGNPSYPDLAWDSNFQTSADILTGDGDANPYKITNVYELQAMKYSLGANYTLVIDVDAERTEGWFEDDDEPQGFDPIGSNGKEFTGTFDGNNNTIANLYSNRNPGNSDGVGFFGNTDGSLIQYLALEDIDIKSEDDRVGGLAGYNGGDIQNVSVSGTVTGSDEVGGLVGENNAGTISRSYTTGNVSANAGFNPSPVGGLVGLNEGGDILESYSTSDITSEGGAAGGLVGENDGGTISNSYATGYVDGKDNNDVGGLVGDNDGGTISNSYATGDVTGDDDVGGLIGDDSDGTVSNSYATGDVTGDGNRVGGLSGSATTISESYATGTINGSSQVGGVVGRLNNDGDISVSYATGDVTGDGNRVGGLAGRNNGNITGSYATGTVTGDDDRVGGLAGYSNGDIVESYATGIVIGSGSSVGGLVGENDGTITAGYWDTETTNQTQSAGGTGLLTAQMTGTNATEADNMGALNFSDTWTATDSYPLLQWSITSLDLSLADDELTEGENTDATVTVTTVDDRAISATTTSSYTTDPTSVASVDADGTVSADSEGSTTITAELVSHADTFALSVLASGGSGGSSSSSGGSPPVEQPEDQDGETTDDVEEPVNNDTSNESADGSESEVPVETDDTNDIDDETPGFGVLVGIVSLLGASLLLGRRTL